MEKDTLMKLTYRELMELYRDIREEIRRREWQAPINVKEKPYGTNQP